MTHRRLTAWTLEGELQVRYLKKFRPDPSGGERAVDAFPLERHVMSREPGRFAPALADLAPEERALAAKLLGRLLRGPTFVHSLRRICPDQVVLEDLLGKLCRQGLVVLVEGNDSTTRTRYSLKWVCLRPEAEEDVALGLGRRRSPEEVERLVRLIGDQIRPDLPILPVDKPDAAGTLRRLEETIEAQKAQLRVGRSFVEFPDGRRINSDSPSYEGLLRALIGVRGALADYLQTGRTTTLRSLSNAVFGGHSKELSVHRRNLETLLGSPLEDIGITSHEFEIRMGGHLVYRLDGEEFRTTWGRPFCTITATTAREMEIRSLNAGRVLVVENRTCFEELLRRGFPWVSDSLLIWGAGYPAEELVTFLQKVESSHPGIPILGWHDPDPDGMAILRDFRAKLGRMAPVLMDAKAFRRLKHLRNLTLRDLRILEGFDSDPDPDLRSLAGAIRAAGGKGEQEEFLAILSDGEWEELLLKAFSD